MRNQQRKEEILDAIHELCDELQQLDVESSDVKGAKKLVGKVVVITVGEGYTGRRAIVTGPRGKSKKPMYWYLRLLDDGSLIYKCKTSFFVLERLDGDTAGR
jgi:hypothetical protein